MLEEPDEVRAWNDEAQGARRSRSSQAGGARRPARAVNALCEKMNDVGLRARAAPGSSAASWWASSAAITRRRSATSRRCAEKHPEIGVLHLDAHADLRDAYEGFTWSHASIMFNVLERIPQVKKLVQVGIRDFSRERARS